MKYMIKNLNGDVIQEASNIRSLAYKWNQLLIWANQLEIFDNGEKIDSKIVEDKFNQMVKEATPIKIKRSKLRGNQTIYK